MALKQLRQLIGELYCVDEIAHIESLRAGIHRTPEQQEAVSLQARKVCNFALNAQGQSNTLQDLLQEFQLSSDEGIALMALTEALLRIPDQAVATQLIADRIQPLNLATHFDDDKSSLIKASTFMLMLSGKCLVTSGKKSLEGYVHKLIRRISQPVIYNAMSSVIGKLAQQFVFAESMSEALNIATESNQDSDLYSLDMLGEAAVCEADAERYLAAYKEAIEKIGAAGAQSQNSVSIKLSALYPRYEVRHESDCLDRLYERLVPLINLAHRYGISITFDAEEAARLELSLDLFSRLMMDPLCFSDSHLGLAVQAYSTRAMATLKYLKALAEHCGETIPVRLVKGAYWDSEIKQTQLDGLEAYPVFTSKHHTDLSYLACAEFLLANRHCFYPQFASHNAVTICDILQLVEPDDSYEFQRLHGMGAPIYEAIRQDYPSLKVRVYGPVGEHKALLPYLVRRILENGANSAFLRQLLDDQDSLEQICEHPCRKDIRYQSNLPLPADIYKPVRENSRGLNLSSSEERLYLMSELEQLRYRVWESDLVAIEVSNALAVSEIRSPYDASLVGSCHKFSPEQAMLALEKGEKAFQTWRNASVSSRADILRRFAQQLEEHRLELCSLLIREAGKTIQDALNEVREAVDFAYYYASSLEHLVNDAKTLPGVVGELNNMYLRGRGVFLCISPWNFPLAIFSGQICAALAAGNTVLAKPAELTPLIARYAIRLLHKSGLDETAVQLLPGKGSEICPDLCVDNRLAGVAFTGSTDSARHINQTLSRRSGAIIPFIAETGGQNCMIVDSSALREQVVKDVMHSAFYSAGQRCSALRVLYLQEEVADDILALLEGAVETLRLGDPADLSTDIGPVISVHAKHALEQHCHVLETKGKLLFSLPLQEGNSPLAVAPHVFEIDSINDLKQEYFGPILHVIRYNSGKVDQVIEEINAYGFGLTCGIHSRNESWALHLAAQLNIGNIYINRDMIGATVGAQPFGGQGLSGTGFKAGGPHYLLRFMAETTITNNLSAIGGSVELVAPRK